MSIFAGTLAAQGVTFAASLLLARLFAPASFGVFVLVLAVSMALSQLISLRLEAAVPLPRAESTARCLIALGFVSIAAWCLVLTPALLALAQFGEPNSLLGWAWTVPLTASAMSGFQLLNALAIRQGRLSTIGRRNVVQALVTAALQVAAGLMGAGVGGLVAGLFLGQVVGAATLWRGSGMGVGDAAGVTAPRVRAATKKYLPLTLPLAPAGLINSLGLQAPLLLVGWGFGVAAAGWFGLTQRVLAVPVALVGQAAAQVYLSELAKAKRSGFEVGPSLFFAASRRLAAVSLVGGAVLIVAAPLLFRTVFGNEWSPSGDLARALVPALLGQMVAAPLSQTLIVYGRSRLQLAWDMSRLVSVVSVFCIGVQVGSSLVTIVAIHAVVTLLWYAASWELSRRTLVSP